MALQSGVMSCTRWWLVIIRFSLQPNQNEESAGGRIMQEQSTHEHDVMNARGSVGRKVIVAGLSLAVLFVSVIATFWLLNTVPRSRRRKPRQYSTLVEVISAQKSQKQVVLDAMGTVQAAQQVTLFPRVRGEIVWLNRGLLPGGFYRRRQRLLRIDPADYRLLVSQASSALAA